MNEEQKKLLEALWTIKMECAKYSNCEKCPMGIDRESSLGCMVNLDDPQDWDLKPRHEEEKPWSPFKERNDE